MVLSNLTNTVVYTYIHTYIHTYIKNICIAHIINVNECQRDDTSVLSEHAASNPDDDVRLLIDDTSTVRQIFIQTAAMKEMFAKFQEVVMLDGTYSINNCGMPLYAFLVQAGHGHGQLVGLCLLAGEDSPQMRVKLCL